SFFSVLSINNPETFCPSTFPFSGYYVRATDAYGCTASDFAIVEQINTPINVDFDFSSLGCGATMDVQFMDLTSDTTTGSIAAWFWSTSDGQISNLQDPVFTFSQNQAYTVSLQVTLDNGCSGTFTDTVDVSTATLNSGLLVGLCDGATQIELNSGGDPNLDYQWSGQGLSSTTIANPIATPPSTPYVYTVTVTGSGSLDTCVAVYSITVASPPPLVLEVNSDTTFCTSPMAISVNHNGTNLEWSLNPSFNPIALVNINPIYVNFGALPSTFVIYVRTTDDYGCSLDDVVTLNYITSPVVVDFDMAVQSCSEDLPVQFTDLTADTSISPIASWAWNFSNGTSSTQANPLVSYNGNGPHYASLNVTLANGCTGVMEDSLLYDLPFITSPDSIGLCGDTSVVLNPGGNPNFTYQWAPSTGLSSTTVASPTATLNSTITYTVTVSAVNGTDTCTLVDTIVVRAGDFIFEALPDTLICNNTIDLIVNSPNLDSIEWALDPNFNLLLGFTNPLTVNINDDRWFYVRGWDGFGCMAMDSVFIRVKDDPLLADFTTSPVYCGDSLILDFVDITSDTIDNPITAWSWDFGNGQTATIPNPSSIYNSSGSYLVSMDILTQNGCAASVSKLVELNLPSIQFPSDSLSICLGDSVALNPNADPNLDYIWSPNIGLNDPFAENPVASPSINTIYNVIISGSFSIDGTIDTCETSATVRVIVPDPVVIDIQGDSIGCNDSIDLNVISNTANNFIWSDLADFSTILSTEDNPAFDLEQDTSLFYVQGIDSYGCTAEDSIEIISRALEIIGDTATICAGDLVILDAAVLLGTNDSLIYTWSPDNVIISGQGTASISSAPETDVLFEIVAQNSLGCSDTTYAQILIGGTYPDFTVTSSPDSILIGETAQIEVNAAAFYNYIWQEDESLDTGDPANPLASPVETTTYYLTLSDDFGCARSDSIRIKVNDVICEAPYIFVPNAFTPNGDGLNDGVYVRGNVIQEFYFVIYDRWGEKVFETTNQADYWDGTFRGRKLNPDVYGYYLECECVGGQKYFKKGNITLIR
ncbi:MAG: PKD domain-containing protein, partial [Saprospiraceae bacterium]|nr:PKD domain-containing protein [Saprospiraceae bacterium]